MTTWPGDAVLTRLDLRRAELVHRFEMIEAAGELNEPGGEIAFEALRSEMDFLLELYELLYAIASGLARYDEPTFTPA